MLLLGTEKSTSALFRITRFVFIFVFCATAGAYGSDLRVGLSAEITSLDPHYAQYTPNMAISAHFFDTLVDTDRDGKLTPGLATSWRAIDPTTWEIKLRPNVRFHDGTELAADDVIFSLDRPARMVNRPGQFTANTNSIIEKLIVDENTIILKTAKPYGPLILDLSNIFIVSKKASENASAEDFDSGKALIGTGPFKFVSFKRGDRIEMVRNENYWGAKPVWEKVTMRILLVNPSRVAALLAGDVDVIEAVPTSDVARLKTNQKIRVAERASLRTIFWTFDHRDRSAPFVTDLDGKRLKKNPLADVRVRRAISLAIDRDAIVAQTMQGHAKSASNLVPPGISGFNSMLAVEKTDPATAKKLLAAAGYPNGFGITLHGPSNRYVNDEQVVQNVAQFLTKIGIRAKVFTMPIAVYFGRGRTGEFSMALQGWTSLTTDFALRSLVATRNTQIGWGPGNWGEYSNATVDHLIASALASIDTNEREKFAREGASAALKDYAVIPMHHQNAIWAMKKDLSYSARIDEATLAYEFTRK